MVLLVRKGSWFSAGVVVWYPGAECRLGGVKWLVPVVFVDVLAVVVGEVGKSCACFRKVMGVC